MKEATFEEEGSNKDISTFIMAYKEFTRMFQGKYYVKYYTDPG